MINDVFGRTVELVSSDANFDHYILGGAIPLDLPVGTSTPAVYVAAARQGKLSQIAAAANDFINSKYTIEQRVTLIGLYLNAKEQGLTNRIAYLVQILAFQNSIISVTAAMVSAVNASTSPSAIAAMAIDFSGVSADPQITALGAIAIGD